MEDSCVLLGVDLDATNHTVQHVNVALLRELGGERELASRVVHDKNETTVAAVNNVVRIVVDYVALVKGRIHRLDHQLLAIFHQPHFVDLQFHSLGESLVLQHSVAQQASRGRRCKHTLSHGQEVSREDKTREQEALCSE